MKSILRIIVDAFADIHKHLRGLKKHARLTELSIEGGADLLGLQPNEGDGLRTAEEVDDYHQHAVTVPLSRSHWRRPHMIPFLMITEETTNAIIDKCVDIGIVHAKIYPKDRTTKSQSGVVRYARTLPQVQHCGRRGMHVHVHPEHPNMTFINRDAEYAFLAIVQMYLEETDTSIIWEHGTDARCIPFWKKWAKTGKFAVTLTAHHLAANEDDILGDVKAVCKPPIKTEPDRQALLQLVSEDYHWVMGISDDAFHSKRFKHVVVGKCACGACTAPFLAPLHAHACDDLLQTPEGVEIFQRFTSRNARKYFGLPEASRQITLERSEFEIPLKYKVGSEVVLPFGAGQKLKWKLVD